MGDHELLLLGILMHESQHGYQINEFIDKNLNRITNMKKATAYAVLKRLNNKGFVNSTLEQEGNRPPRQVYSITEKGKQEFTNLIRKSLKKGDSFYLQGDMGLMFLHHLPLKEVAAYLETRLDQIKHLIIEIKEIPKHGKMTGVDIALDHRYTLLVSEKEWLIRTLDCIRNQNNKNNS